MLALAWYVYVIYVLTLYTPKIINCKLLDEYLYLYRWPH